MFTTFGLSSISILLVTTVLDAECSEGLRWCLFFFLFWKNFYEWKTGPKVTFNNFLNPKLASCST